MKKILYYLAQILLVISTLFVGFVTSTEMMILCVSCLITGCLLMLVYALSSEKNFCAFFLYGMAASAHFFYLFALQSFARADDALYRSLSDLEGDDIRAAAHFHAHRCSLYQDGSASGNRAEYFNETGDERLYV